MFEYLPIQITDTVPGVVPEYSVNRMLECPTYEEHHEVHSILLCRCVKTFSLYVEHLCRVNSSSIHGAVKQMRHNATPDTANPNISDEPEGWNVLQQADDVLFQINKQLWKHVMYDLWYAFVITGKSTWCSFIWTAALLAPFLSWSDKKFIGTQWPVNTRLGYIFQAEDCNTVACLCISNVHVK